MTESNVVKIILNTNLFRSRIAQTKRENNAGGGREAGEGECREKEEGSCCVFVVKEGEDPKSSRGWRRTTTRKRRPIGRRRSENHVSREAHVVRVITLKLA